MRGGFGGVVAVPAWAQFMRDATKGRKPEWYSMPSDVEKVTICRLSGARASEACRHPERYAPVVATSFSPAWHESASEPVQEDEPPVYEDLFPAGSLPSQPCPMHTAEPIASPVGTPLVDAALRRSVVGSAVRTGTRLFVDKITDGNGIIRYVVTQR
jgi:hypothetical protein